MYLYHYKCKEYQLAAGMPGFIFMFGSVPGILPSSDCCD
jgi:hypothetical protein